MSTQNQIICHALLSHGWLDWILWIVDPMGLAIRGNVEWDDVGQRSWAPAQFPGTKAGWRPSGLTPTWFFIGGIIGIHPPDCQLLARESDGKGFLLDWLYSILALAMVAPNTFFRWDGLCVLIVKVETYGCTKFMPVCFAIQIII